MSDNDGFQERFTLDLKLEEFIRKLRLLNQFKGENADKLCYKITDPNDDANTAKKAVKSFRSIADIKTNLSHYSRIKGIDYYLSTKQIRTELIDITEDLMSANTERVTPSQDWTREKTDQVKLREEGEFSEKEMVMLEKMIGYAPKLDGLITEFSKEFSPEYTELKQDIGTRLNRISGLKSAFEEYVTSDAPVNQILSDNNIKSSEFYKYLHNPKNEGSFEFRSKKNLTHKDRMHIGKLVDTGSSLEEVAAQYGKSVSTIRKAKTLWNKMYSEDSKLVTELENTTYEQASDNIRSISMRHNINEKALHEMIPDYFIQKETEETKITPEYSNSTLDDMRQIEELSKVWFKEALYENAKHDITPFLKIMNFEKAQEQVAVFSQRNDIDEKNVEKIIKEYYAANPAKPVSKEIVPQRNDNVIDINYFQSQGSR